jgi:FkbM family methyltransferase
MKLKHWIRYVLFKDTTWHGEYRALAALLRDIKEAGKTVVDVGANDGFYGSNSFPFISRGWGAILVEPHPQPFGQASKLHARNPKVTVLNLACGDQSGILPLYRIREDHTLSTLDIPEKDRTPERAAAAIRVEVQRLEHVLEQQAVPADFGLLSIDTEGYDYRVMQGLNLSRFRPQVIITEKDANDHAKFAFLRKQHYELKADLWGDTIWMPQPDAKAES